MAGHVFACQYQDGYHACWPGECPNESPVIFENVEGVYTPREARLREEDETGVIYPSGWTVQQPTHKEQ